MQLADWRRNNDSPSSLSSHIISPANSLDNFLSDTTSSSAVSSCVPSSLPNTLHKPDIRPYRLPNVNNLSEADFAHTLETVTKDLDKPKDKYLSLNTSRTDKDTRIPSKGEPIGIFPYRFPSNTPDIPQVPKQVLPSSADPYWTNLLSSTSGPVPYNLIQSPVHKPQTFTKEEAGAATSFSDHFLKTAWLYQPSLFNAQFSHNLVLQSSSTPGRSVSDSTTAQSAKDRFSLFSDSSLVPLHNITDWRIISNTETVVSKTMSESILSSEKADLSTLVLPSSSNGCPGALESAGQFVPANCTPLKHSASPSGLYHSKRTRYTCTTSNCNKSIISTNTNPMDTKEDIMSCLGKSNAESRKLLYKGVDNNITREIRECEMYQTFQSWAIKNYGDSGKTKTVTRNKYQRILRILTGEEQFTAENSKFRFWVKAKGFRVSSEEEDELESRDKILLVPSKHSVEGQHEMSKSFKRVAVVENFFDIIYNVHVEMDGRGGKHAGQKRTYRADDCVVTEVAACTLTKPARTRFSCDASDHDEESVSSDSLMSREASPSPKESGESKEEGEASPVSLNNNKEILLEEPKDMTSARRSSPQPMETETRATDSPTEDASSRKPSPVPGKIAEVKGHPERKRRASSESGDSALTKTSEGKDDDDDDDNDDDEKMPVGQDIDPERLKAFNMFVRLFVDENLDRMVPISKQPKDKIQAILEACDRQFPEFHERSRKRIRTYLKSCRRMRRSKEHNGWEPLRPTPPHLTSAAAESLLATACENESQNAKRMRLGLEPLPASAMVSHNPLVMSQTPPSTQPSSQQQQQTQSTPVTQAPSQPCSISSPRSISCSVPGAPDFLRHQPPPPTFRPAPEFNPSFFTNGHGATLFRPGFPSYQHPAHHHHPSVIPHTPISANTATNGEFGPTDLSMKKSSNKGQLSPSEVTAIKQLIAGYRESAAFLYRSADELEQLLLQQN